MSRHGPTKVLIEYGAIDHRPGWMPMLWDAGKASPTRYGERLYERAEALRIARAEALEVSTRYVGDWDVTVRERGT